MNLETDFADRRFRAGAVLFVGREGDSVPRAITAVRFHKGRPVVALEGVETMDDAEALAGAGLWVQASALEPLPEGTFYHHDLVGCEVRDTAGRLVGRVRAIEGPMERSQLVVESPKGAEVLIPLAAEICETVDLAARRIVVHPPEGLIELNRAGRLEDS